jgi:hypothetical protein
MKTTELFDQMMRQSRLGKADLKAVARNRGFTAAQVASRDLFAHLFLSR